MSMSLAKCCEQRGSVLKMKKHSIEIRIYLAIMAKLLKLQRFDSINYLPSVGE